MRTIYDDAPRVAAWVSAKAQTIIMPPFMAIGWEDETGLRVGVVFNDYIPGGNIELTLAAEAPISRRMLTEVARYVFGQLKCSRMSVTTQHVNEHVKGMALRVGFKPESIRADYYGEGAHAALFRMKRRECKWLRADA